MPANIFRVKQGGTGVGTAGITAFNNITGFSASGSTGTTSTNLVFSTSPTLVTPTLGVASATSLAASGAITSSSATAGIGYATGAGGTVTQATSKSTGVTLDKVTGKITMNNAPLASATTVTFVLTNSAIAVTDTVSISIVSGEVTDASYQILPPKVAVGSCKITIWNITSGSLSEALVLQFNVHKGAIS